MMAVRAEMHAHGVSLSQVKHKSKEERRLIDRMYVISADYDMYADEVDELEERILKLSQKTPEEPSPKSLKDSQLYIDTKKYLTGEATKAVPYMYTYDFSKLNYVPTTYTTTTNSTFTNWTLDLDDND